MQLIETHVFSKWLLNLKDVHAKAKIIMRIKRLSEGNHGDVNHIGSGLSEMRIHYGPGYRIYFKDTGKEIILLLCGGDKSTQSDDIKKAIKLAKEYNDNNENS